ncbi:phenylalanine--tRNA ligase subunit beta [Spiroplasma endosymbiont of Panorpa germanica]|uniref:phenylalanine--tRNA ligase subunit beta n=1 Tax=Spiroplasma endosymbiont of Panorpa germanica TaxID=3066314 RepID=UPI0030CB3D2F
MIITRNWLDRYIDLKGIKNEEISVALNSLGFEVEEENDYKGLNDELVLGRVSFCEKMPGTHLSSTFVDTGTDLPHMILCGASNVGEGQFVITALPGMTIANGLTINKREIQGKSSEGMICSLTEIGMKPEFQTEKELDGIYEIHAKEDLYKSSGDSILEQIGFEDYTWEVDLTLNRSDALSALQLAKEVGNYFNRDFNFDFKNNIAQVKKPINIDVQIDTILSDEVKMIAYSAFETKKIYSLDSENLFIYSNDELMMKYSGIKKEDSFFEDLSNLIAFESGQPTIFLDPDKITAPLKITNLGSDKEPKIGLTMDDKVVVILGNNVEKEFQPTEKSLNLVALFLNISPIIMRRQQKLLNKSNCVLQRFMKPMSTNLVIQANEITTALLQKYDFIDTRQELAYIKKPDFDVKKILLPSKRIREYLGFGLNLKRIQKLFSQLDFQITTVGEKNNTFEFICDPNRLDLNFEADIIEEIARLYGYDNIKAVPPTLTMVGKPQNLARNVQSKLANYLIGAGYANVKTYSLTKAEDVSEWDLFKLNNPIKLMSPISKNHEVYRQSLAKSLIDVVELNSSRGNKSTKLYEVADIYNLSGVRQRHLAIAITGDLIDDKVFKTKIAVSFEYLKAICENILTIMNVDLSNVDFIWNSESNNDMHPFINAKICYEQKVIGFLFKLNPKKEQSLKVAGTLILELNLSEIEAISKKVIDLKPISRFQKTSRDVSFEIQDDKNLGSFFKDIIKDVDHLIGFKVIDVYVDEKLQSNQLKAIAMNFTFNSLEKQLSDNEINDEFNKIIANIDNLGLKVR